MNVSDSEPAAKITGDAFEQLIARYMDVERFPFRVESIGYGAARLRLSFDERQLRPGGSIAGPVMFTLADTTLYALVMSVAGPVVQAVTTDLGIRFLSRPGRTDLIADGRLLKASGRLLVGEVTFRSEGRDTAVAHATGTFAVPRGLPEPAAKRDEAER